MTHQTHLSIAIQNARNAGFIYFAAALETLYKQEYPKP